MRNRAYQLVLNIAVLTLGPIGHTVQQAIEILNDKDHCIAHYDMRFLKPIDESLLHQVGKRFKKIITVEDGTIYGGLGSAVIEFMNDNDYASKVKRIGIPDHFVEG